MNEPVAKNSIEVQEVSLLSIHHEALLETGKAILKDSVTTGREFCKSMIGTSSGAIPIYLGILTFLLPKDFKLGVITGAMIAIPAVCFLIAAILFTLGYLPISAKFSLDMIEEVEAALEKNVAYRKRFIWSGMTVFVVSTVFAILAVVMNIGAK